MIEQPNPQVPMVPEARRPIPPAPIHPLAALATIVLDNIFGVYEIFDPLALVLTSLGVGQADRSTPRPVRTGSPGLPVLDGRHR